MNRRDVPQTLGHQDPSLGGVPFPRRLVRLDQDTQLGAFVVDPRFARSGRVIDSPGGDAQSQRGGDLRHLTSASTMRARGTMRCSVVLRTQDSSVVRSSTGKTIGPAIPVMAGV